MSAKVRRLVEIIRYLSIPRPSVFYIGWNGYDNLGDEAIMEATNMVLSPLNTAYRRPLSNIFLQDFIDYRHHAGTLLGGGTQIGPHSPLDWFEYGLNKFGTGIVFGTGVTPIDKSEPPEWLHNWGRVLTRCKYVGVRGVESAHTLSMVGVKAEVLGDTACLFAQDHGYWRPHQRTLGINVGQSNGYVFGSEENIISIMGDFVRNMIKRGWKIEFFCVWPPDLDITIKTARLAGIEKPIIHINYKDANSYLELVKNITVFVGIKLHSVVLAICAGVPSIMLEYRPKCREFMDSVGMLEYNIRTDMLNTHDLINRVEKLEEHGLDISNMITTHAIAQRELLAKRGSMLRALLLSRS